MVRHLAMFLQRATDTEFSVAKKMCTTIGPVLVKPMSDALMGEDNARTVRRLRDILISFGPAAREYANELKSSRNPAVRRAAIDLLRGLAGDAALPDLRVMLDDPDAQVQREALRAIIQVGTNEAYQMLEQALKSGVERTREAIMQALGALPRREGRAAVRPHPRRTPTTRARTRPSTRRRSSRSARSRSTSARRRRSRTSSIAVNGGRAAAPRASAPPRRARCAAWARPAPIARSRRPPRPAPGAVRKIAKAALAEPATPRRRKE